MRVSYWIMANMEQVIEDRCSLFLALAVTDLIVASLKEDPSWQLALEFIVGLLLNLIQVKIHFFFLFGFMGIPSSDNFSFFFILLQFNINVAEIIESSSKDLPQIYQPYTNDLPKIYQK